MESFINDYLTSTDYDSVNEEILLERRISPYATLRPGDLASLLQLQSSFFAPVKSSRSHGNHHKIDTIIEKEQLGLSSDESDDERSDDGVGDIVCRGEDQGHIPAEYVVSGVKPHEMPVIGVCVDKKICPGFRYRVRRVNSDKHFWDGKAKTLESIGMGYGRRLTFSGDQLNSNDCFFWSDSEPQGFAFSIEAVQVGQTFLVQDVEETVVGEGYIEKIHEPQRETTMTCERAGVTKQVEITITCHVTYHQRNYSGLMELVAAESTETIEGVAVLRKPRSSRKAILVAIEDVFLPRIGPCRFVSDC